MFMRAYFQCLFRIPLLPCYLIAVHICPYSQCLLPCYTFLNFDMFMCAYFQHLFPSLPCYLLEFWYVHVCLFRIQCLFPYCCAYVCLFPTLISLYYPVTFLNFDMFKCVLISNAYSLITLLPYCCAYVCLFPTLISLYYPVTFLNFDMFMRVAYFQCLFLLLYCRSAPVQVVPIIRKVRIDRVTTTWKIQGELRRFERRPFVGQLHFVLTKSFWLVHYSYHITLLFSLCVLITHYPYYTVSFHVHMFPRNLVALCKYCNYHKLLLRFYLANQPFNLYTYYLLRVIGKK
jgi:hypothetical protein